MGLVQCKECKNAISDKATQCPHCGYKPRQKGGCLVVILFAIIMTAITSQCESKKLSSSVEPTNSQQNSPSNSENSASNNLQQIDVTPLSVREICVATISVIFSKPLGIIKSTEISTNLSQAEYTRTVDNTWWRYQCRLTQNTVEWRAMGSTSEPNKEGRWRTEYWVDGVNINGDSVVFYKIDQKSKKLYITEEPELTKSDINNVSSYNPKKFDFSFNFSKLKQ